MNLKEEICSYCGSNDFVIGRHNGYGNVYPNKLISIRDQKLYHVICLKCGTVVRSYVKKPEKLVIRKRKSLQND